MSDNDNFVCSSLAMSGRSWASLDDDDEDWGSGAKLDTIREDEEESMEVKDHDLITEQNKSNSFNRF